MHTSMQPNTYLIGSVTVETNPGNPDLLTLSIDETETTSMHLTLVADVWQRVADQLAAAGITPERVTS